MTPPAPRKLPNIVLEDTRLIWRNFQGKEDTMNAKGNRVCTAVLPNDVGEQMLKDGWNVKYLRPREEGDQPQASIKFKISYKGRPPKVVLITSRGQNQLDEDTVGMLDYADVQKVDLILSPYPYTVNGKSGIAAYLQTIYVTINEDELELKYSNFDEANQSPEDIHEREGVQFA